MNIEFSIRDEVLHNVYSIINKNETIFTNQFTGEYIDITYSDKSIKVEIDREFNKRVLDTEKIVEESDRPAFSSDANEYQWLKLLYRDDNSIDNLVFNFDKGLSQMDKYVITVKDNEEISQSLEFIIARTIALRLNSIFTEEFNEIGKSTEFLSYMDTSHIKCPLVLFQEFNRLNELANGTKKLSILHSLQSEIKHKDKAQLIIDKRGHSFVHIEIPMDYMVDNDKNITVDEPESISELNVPIGLWMYDNSIESDLYRGKIDITQQKQVVSLDKQLMSKSNGMTCKVRGKINLMFVAKDFQYIKKVVR